MYDLPSVFIWLFNFVHNAKILALSPCSWASLTTSISVKILSSKPHSGQSVVTKFFLYQCLERHCWYKRSTVYLTYRRSHFSQSWTFTSNHLVHGSEHISHKKNCSCDVLFSVYTWLQLSEAKFEFITISYLYRIISFITPTLLRIQSLQNGLKTIVFDGLTDR